MGSKKNTLSLKEKMEVIDLSEKLTVRQLCDKFKCGKTQIYGCIKNKNQLKEEWLKGDRNLLSKRQKICPYEEINNILFKWFIESRNKNLSISGPMLQEQAKQIALLLGNSEFKASNGWLDSFRKRHSISFNQTSGEAKKLSTVKDDNLLTVDEWKNNIEEICSGYSAENIANCAETGLFFRALPNKTLMLKNEKCIGGKLSKERLTILICGFADGTLEKPIVIGNLLNPPCFKNAGQLPLEWFANKRAWMTLEIMEKWLTNLNEKMKNQHRNILMFMDDATCHPRKDLSNIKFVFFPANTTRLTQPMDQGVIKNLKTHYRKRLLQSLVARSDSSAASMLELTKHISVLDAVRWISESYKNVSKLCVKNAFKQAGFNIATRNLENLISFNDILGMFHSTGNVSISEEEYVAIDSNVKTEEDFESIDEVLTVDTQEVVDDSGDEEGQTEHNILISKVKNFSDAMIKIAELDEFAIRINSPEMRHCLLTLKSITEKESVLSKALKQKTILDFFQKK